MKPTGVSSDGFHTKKISKVKRRPAQSQHLADRETARQALIAAIDKSRSSQLRVSLSEWRGNRQRRDQGSHCHHTRHLFQHERRRHARREAVA